MHLLRFGLVGNYKGFYKDLKVVGKELKKLPQLMFVDTAISTVLFKSGLQDYLNYKFYLKNFKERNKYVTIGYQANFYEKAANVKYAPFFSNKPNFLKNFEKYTKRDFYSPEEDILKLQDFLNKHDVFVMKPANGLGGTSITKVNRSEISDIEAFRYKLKDERLFIEEFIIQNKEWGKISPNSVNTLRVMTTAVAGKSKLIFAAARIGSGICLADNFHQGGMGVLIDLEKGILIGPGINKRLERFDNHPVTNEKIDGYVIPYWEEIKKMTLEAALVNDSVNIVGWDVAITEDGPIIIEGNRGPGWDLVQVLLNKGTKYMMEDLKREMKANGLWK